MILRPLFILADLEAGGAQRVILTISRHLNRKKIEPHLGIIDKSGPLSKETPENVDIHNLNVSRVRYSLPGIIKLCWSLRPEAVVSTLGHLNLLLLAVKKFLPGCTRLIVREANSPSIRLRYTKYPSLYKLSYRKLYPLADKVVCNSKYMQKDLINSFNLSAVKTAVIPNPVDSEKIHQFIENSHNPYQSGRIHIVSVGRLNYQKGFDMLLKAFKYSFREVSNLYLTIVGTGPEENILKRLVNDLGVRDSVNFVGHQDNPYPFMAHADLFISSSRWEGLPNVVLESLACGTPVLAFDCPGGTSEIIRDEQNGWLVPSEDWEAMSKKIVELVKNKKWLKLKKDSLLPDAFQCENVIRKYEELLMEVNSSI